MMWKSASSVHEGDAEGVPIWIQRGLLDLDVG